MNHRLPAACSLAALALLAGCNTRTDVSLTGNTPAQYSHVWITTQQVWFNNSSTAGPQDGGWAKFVLSTPTTIDLVTVNSGNLSDIQTALRVIPGTYSQVMLIPLDASTALTTSAQNAGALYNSEADYVDSSGTTHQLPLEMLNPNQGIGIATSLKVPVGSVGLGAALATGVGGATSTGTTLGTTNTTTDTTTGATTGSGFGIGSNTGTSSGLGTGVGSTSSTTPNNAFAIAIDGASDLVPFSYGGASGCGQNTPCEGILLSQHASAYDVSRSGGISGQLSLSNITTSTSGLPAIQVSAQVLTSDSTRHEVVASTAVQSDGSFLLYPLAASTNGTFYDLVIHGPGIATIIIKSVEITLPSSSNSLLSSNNNTLNSNTTTNGITTNGTTTNGTTVNGTTVNGTTVNGTTVSGTTNTSATNVVAIGTLTPRAATATYTANLATSPAATLPGGALLKFYQTIARQGEVPYVIEYSPIDPFGEVLFAPQPLSNATVDSGTWSASGSNVSVVSAAPAQGTGAYTVAASAPSYNDGALTPVVHAPASGTTTPVTVVVPGLTLAAGTGSGTLTATVSQATPGKYGAGELLVSHAGTLVATAPLDLAAGSASVTIDNLPAQTATALYFLTVHAWNTSTPSKVQIQSYPNEINMQGSASSSVALTVN
jgi:uncharacterized protein DUF4382